MQKNVSTPGGKERARIFLVDDHAVVRFGLGQYVSQQEDLEVCGEAENANVALEGVARCKPDLVIVDIALEKSSGLDLTRNLKVRHPDLPVLVVSMQDESVYGEIALRAGASGYIMKNKGLGAILGAIRQVLQGNLYMSEELSARLLQERVVGQAVAQGPPLKTLSERELEVFRLIGQWKGTREIAGQLNLSIKTIEYYREQIKKKLHLRDAAELLQSATTWVQGGTN